MISCDRCQVVLQKPNMSERVVCDWSITEEGLLCRNCLEEWEKRSREVADKVKAIRQEMFVKAFDEFRRDYPIKSESKQWQKN